MLLSSTVVPILSQNKTFVYTLMDWLIVFLSFKLI